VPVTAEKRSQCRSRPLAQKGARPDLSMPISVPEKASCVTGRPSDQWTSAICFIPVEISTRCDLSTAEPANVGIEISYGTRIFALGIGRKATSMPSEADKLRTVLLFLWPATGI